MPEKTPEKAPGSFSLLGTASTMGLHMVSGPIVGGGLGWLIDSWLDSWPVASAVGLVLGLAAGFRNVWADARYLERSNAAIDAERKKKEEEAKNAPEQASKEERSALSRTIVPVGHKGEDAPSEASPSARSSEAEEAKEHTPEGRTASLLAGTATYDEQELEELDETMEAIRRVLAGGGEAKPSGNGPESGGKGVV